MRDATSEIDNRATRFARQLDGRHLCERDRQWVCGWIPSLDNASTTRYLQASNMDHVTVAAQEKDVHVNIRADVPQRLRSGFEHFTSQVVAACQVCVYFTRSLTDQEKTRRTSFVDALRRSLHDEYQLSHVPGSPFILDVNVQLTDDTHLDILSVKVTRQAIVLSGFYFKRSRTISQTPFIVDGGKRRLGTGSVQEIICNVVKKAFYRKPEHEKEIVFASAGREDVDVRCLGMGRKFLLTIPEPTLHAEADVQWDSDFFGELMGQISLESNDTVRVKDLNVASLEDRNYVQEGAELRRKLYVCVVEAESPIGENLLRERLDDVSNLVIYQKTPLRVAHRRAMLTRERTLHHIVTAWVSPTIFVMTIDAGAGMYIKEFVHGDLGRTSPSISDILGVSCRLVTLDFFGCVDPNSPSRREITAEDFV